MKFENKIKKFKKYDSNKKYFLNKVIEVYSDFFFNKIKIKNIIEIDNEDEGGGYWLSVEFDTTDEQWDEFEKLSDKNGFDIDGTDTEFNIFE